MKQQLHNDYLYSRFTPVSSVGLWSERRAQETPASESAPAPKHEIPVNTGSSQPDDHPMVE